jgi:RND superfamily putative drug exporter
MPSRNLAARAGRWSAQHRKRAVLGWILFVVLATVLGGMVGQKTIDESASGNGESRRGDMIVDAAGFPEEAGEQVLIQGQGSIRARDAAVTAAVQDVVNRLERIDGVTDIESPLNAEDRANTVSRDGRSVVVNYKLPGDEDAVDKLVEAPLAAIADAQKGHTGVRIEAFGDVSATKAIAEQDEKEGQRSELISYGLTLLILLGAFGAFVAAGIPLLLGATAVAGTVGLLGPLSQMQSLAPEVQQVVVVIGLAVGVDYAMFYLRRMMEERDKGRSSAEALEVAAATSGRAVLISGVTVMVAMAGMLLAGNPVFVSFGIGTMLVVAVAVLGSMTFLPATLSYLGEKNWLEKGRVPWVAKRRHKTGGESRVWGAVLTAVLKRPLVSAVLAGGLLVALSIPALGLQFKNSGYDGYSRSQPVIQTYDRLQAAFPGGAVQAQTVIKAADVTTPQVRAAIQDLHDKALATGQLMEPSGVEVNPDRTVAIVGLSVKGSGTDAASDRSVEVLRTQVVPATVGRLPGAEVAGDGHDRRGPRTSWTP